MSHLDEGRFTGSGWMKVFPGVFRLEAAGPLISIFFQLDSEFRLVFSTLRSDIVALSSRHSTDVSGSPQISLIRDITQGR